MKVLQGWKMRFILASLLVISAHAGELSMDYLSDSKKKEIELDIQKVEAESSILRDSWLNPITGSYTGSFKDQFGFDQESYSAQVAIDQPIFKSGGIYFAIKYANATAHFNKLGVTIQQKSIIKETIGLMIQLRKLDVEIEKVELLYKDAKETFEYNQEQLLAGEVDQATVNSSEITKNSLEMNILDLSNQKDDLLHQLQIFSDANYQTIKLPTLTLVEKKQFLDTNMDLKQSMAKDTQNEYKKKVTISNYLPTLSAQAAYVYAKNANQAFSEGFTIGDTESEYFSYGFRLSMPIVDINILRTIESAKVDHLKAGVELSAKQKEVAKFYNLIVSKVKRIDQKILLAKKNLILYDKVLINTQASFQAGDQSSLDLLKSKHVLETKKLDIKIYEYDKQLELLALYEKMSDV